MVRSFAGVGLFLFFLLGAAALAASPNFEDPDASFDLLQPKQFEATVAEMDGMYRAAQRDIAKYVQSEEQGRLASLNAQAISKTHVSLVQIRRMAEILRTHGEINGHDFNLRAIALSREVDRLIANYRQLPQFASALPRLKTTATQKSTLFLRLLPRLAQLAEDRGQWEQSEKKVNDEYDDLELYTVYLLSEDRTRIYKPIDPDTGKIRTLANQARAKQADEELIALREAARPKLAALLTDLKTARTSVSQTGNAQIGDETKTGPQTLEYFVEKFRLAQLAMLKARAIEWARAGSTRQNATPELTELENAFAEFTKSLEAELVQLITDDAKRASADQARDLYIAYLAAVSPWLSAAGKPELNRQVEKVLASLAEKSETLAAEVKHYQAATGEVLRWRRRIAQAQAKKGMENFPPIEKSFLEAARTEDEFTGLFTALANSTSNARLLAPAPIIMRRLINQMMEKPVLIQEARGLPAGSSAAISRYHARTYVHFPVPDIESEINRLKEDLRVTDSSPPLSLEAALALHNAQAKNFLQAGGTINRLYLEGLVNRFGDLPEAASVLLPLGELSQESFNSDHLEQVVLRAHIQPAWLQHEYFFLQVKP